MAETPKNPLVLDSFDKKHLQQIAALENKVAAIYAELCKEVGVVGTLFGGKVDLEKVFKLGDYPEINKKVDQIITTLHDKLGSAIVDGVTAQWQLANEKNDDLVRKVFGKDLDNLTEEQIRRYFTTNDAALTAFLARKDKGLGLSQKVWKYAKEAKVDIESALELGIKTGQSAASMARDLKQYLKEPNKLFRRVRDKDGKLHLSKAAQAYHPGQGVYRSSYKNALRLAVTEANMAYRASDYERVQNFDFVVGIEVRLSNNHTLNGKPFYDICDELKGKYPKDFKFRGWHPFCRCHAITILKTREELMADNERILDGQEPTEDSVNSVNDLPDNFKAWAVKNKSRILAADERGTLPYFITDNPYSVNSAIGQPLASVKVPLWYAHNAQVKDIQKELKKYKTWSIEHPKSKKMASLINDADSAILNGESIEKILDKYNFVLKEYKIKMYDAEYAAKKKAEAAKKPTALDIAKKRHETRTQQQIDQTKIEWTARRLNRLKDKIYDGLLPMESYDRITQLYVILLKEHKFDEVNKGIATLQKAVARHKARTPETIKAIKDKWKLRKEAILYDEQFLSTLIPNVKDWKKQFSSKKLHEVYDAVEKKMQQINALPLNKQVAAINKEILYVSDATYLKPHTLYSTWEVSQAAYQVQLGIVQKKIGLTSVWDTLDDIDLWLYKHPKVKKLSGMVDEVKDLINSGADMSEINLKMSAINTEYKNKLYEEQYAAKLKAKKLNKASESFDDSIFTKEKRDNAVWHKTAKEADDYFHENAVEFWTKVTQQEKEALWGYTAGSGYITEPLRAIPGHYYYYSSKFRKTENHIQWLTDALHKQHLKDDTWLKRDSDPWNIDYIFKIDLSKYKKDPSALVGKVGLEDSFQSCGSCRETRFTATGPKKVIMNLYCPKGTPAAYAQPWSSCGTYGQSWDGIKKANPESWSENEVLLQRGAKMRITKAEYDSVSDMWYIDVDVIGFDIRDFDLIQESSGYYCRYK